MHPFLVAAALAVLPTLLAGASPFSSLAAGADAFYLLRLLDVHEATDSAAYAINDAGVVSGGWNNQDHSINAGVIHSAVGLQTIVAPVAPHSAIRVVGVNRQGDTVGAMNSVGFVRNGSGYTFLMPPGTVSSHASAINNAGKVVGGAVAGGADAAWTWDSASGYVALPGLPGYTDHGAVGINNSGAVVGFSTRLIPSTTDTETAAWLSISGNVQLLTFAGTTNFRPIAINDAGDILASYTRVDTGSVLRYAVRRNTVWHTLTWAPLAGMSNFRINGMNNHGEIVGVGTDGTGRQHGFLGRPAWLPEITQQHTELTVGYAAGQLNLTVNEDETPASYLPNAVTIYGGPEARRLVPGGAAFSFLGAAHSAVWVLPQGQELGLPFLGVSSLVSGGIFASNRVYLDLESVNGPGHFFVYTINGLGLPVVRMSSVDGITSADRITTTSGSHAHQNWAFTAPGTWQVAFRLRGTPVGGGADIVSPTQTITFYLEPGRVAPTTTSPLAIGPVGYQFNVSGEVGRECVVYASTNLQTWEIARKFITTTRVTLISEPTHDARRFYRALFR